MHAPIYILGGSQTDFARNWAREELEIYDLFAEALQDAVQHAAIEPAQIEVGHVGNFTGELFAGQGHLGGFFASLHPDLAGVPASRHEAACASGSIALLAAMSELETETVMHLAHAYLAAELGPLFYAATGLNAVLRREAARKVWASCASMTPRARLRGFESWCSDVAAPRICELFSGCNANARSQRCKLISMNAHSDQQAPTTCLRAMRS